MKNIFIVCLQIIFMILGLGNLMGIAYGSDVLDRDNSGSHHVAANGAVLAYGMIATACILCTTWLEAIKRKTTQ